MGLVKFMGSNNHISSHLKPGLSAECYFRAIPSTFSASARKLYQENSFADEIKSRQRKRRAESKDQLPVQRIKQVNIQLVYFSDVQKGPNKLNDNS